MRIDVTDEDIALGELEDCERCPVARSKARATGREFFVGQDDVCLSEAFEPAVQLPAAVTEFIQDFDAGEPVGPFTFDLDLTPFGVR